VLGGIVLEIPGMRWGMGALAIVQFSSHCRPMCSGFFRDLGTAKELMDNFQLFNRHYHQLPMIYLYGDSRPFNRPYGGPYEMCYF
jgi:hypothetical protein